MDYTKAKAWTGKPLTGSWHVTIKADGVRVFLKDGKWHSRNGKPLWNLPKWPSLNGPSEGFEAYRVTPGKSSKENFYETNGSLKAKNKPERALTIQDLFPLQPIDSRLDLGTMLDPTEGEIIALLANVLDAGFEGLVLRQGTKWVKVKPTETYDMTVRDCIEGEGKHKGRLGAVVTDRGNVGTGFTDEEREEWWGWHLFKKAGHAEAQTKRIIEVSCMSLTADGKFRHPRFERLREDKDETDDLN